MGDGGTNGPGPNGPPVHLTLKVAGVHWWYRTRSHAAELTAGEPLPLGSLVRAARSRSSRACRWQLEARDRSGAS